MSTIINNNCWESYKINTKEDFKLNSLSICQHNLIIVLSGDEPQKYLCKKFKEMIYNHNIRSVFKTFK